MEARLRTWFTRNSRPSADVGFRIAMHRPKLSLKVFGAGLALDELASKSSEVRGTLDG
jgi:hypothetical protein